MIQAAKSSTTTFTISGYLENQHLDNAYTSFCETSRHLVKEKQGLKCGNKPLDTSIGLVNIIRDYFTFKSLLNEFLRSCPQSPTIIRLIDSGDSLQRLEIILGMFQAYDNLKNLNFINCNENFLDTLKNNLHKIDKVSTASTKKRKHDNEENVFNLSHSKTSTPEIVHLAKRLKNCLTTPHLTLSTFEESKSQGGTGSKLLYSSSDSSNKEDDDEENLRKSTSKPALKANTEVIKIYTF